MDAAPEMQKPPAPARANGSNAGLQGSKSKSQDSPPAPSRQVMWRLQNPAAFAAHRAVEYAVRRGILKPPSHCECGCGRTGKLDGHHPDHRDPLRVVWLARACHVRLHRRQKGGAG